MARVKRVVEVDAGKDGEYIGLQEGHKKFERRKSDAESKRQHRAEPADSSEGAKHGDETAEYFERDVAGQHVGEQPHAMGYGPRQERQHLDKHHQRQDVDWNPARDE